MFGRRKKAHDLDDDWDGIQDWLSDEHPESDVEITDELGVLIIDDVEITDDFSAPLVSDAALDLADTPGPYDYEHVADRLEEVIDDRLDLGSVVLAVPPGGQLQVEMDSEGAPQSVHLTVAGGRLTVAAYAAPKSPGQWREIAVALAESLRAEGSSVSVQAGPWGRELLCVGDGIDGSIPDMRFIGVDGYRWMLRVVAAGPPGSVDQNMPLVVAAHDVLRQAVVRRGEEPHPVRTPLPVVLPRDLAAQLAAAHQQQQQYQQQQRAAVHPVPVRPTYPTPPPVPDSARHRRATEGSAMQQLRR